MIDRLKKTDRLLKLWLLILKNPSRYSTKELAEKFQVNVKTIYRDIVSLGLELEVPVYNEKAKWVINDSHFLPPVRLTKAEALNLFLAIRLLADHNHRYDPNIDSTFSTLATILPSPLKEQILKTFDWLHKLPKDEKYISNMAKLAEAWTTGHCISMVYRSYDHNQAAERIVEPYFIQPVATGHASYLLAYCRNNKEVRTYKIERIESIRILAETYTVPEEFDANKHLDSAVGIISGKPICNVKLKVKKELARIMQETLWHPSQKCVEQPDGSLIVTLKVAESIELTRWVLRWGYYVEVLQPASLRKEVAMNAKKMLGFYEIN